MMNYQSFILRVIALTLLLSSMSVFSAERSSAVPLEIDGVVVEWELFSLFVLPGDVINVKSLNNKSISTDINSDTLPITNDEKNSWLIKSPEKAGRYQFEVAASDESIKTVINVFVLVPYGQMIDGTLEGYRIGEYPKKAHRGLESYQRPKGFVRVDEQDLDTFVSPHFKLRQFICKQASGYPKFVVLQSSTLSMLEDFLQYVNDSGFKIDTFGVISAYRTPFYNRLIGNVANSRHVYGDSMDLFIDRDGDGRLDDLDGNNLRNSEDVKLLYQLAVEFQEKSKGLYVGGVGKYRPKSSHGGFVHMDNRGYSARW
jgi:hypothetical protein